MYTLKQLLSHRSYIYNKLIYASSWPIALALHTILYYCSSVRFVLGKEISISLSSNNSPSIACPCGEEKNYVSQFNISVSTTYFLCLL